MGVAERRAREKEALRQEILDAATELFASEGYPSVSMRRIAERIEYAPSTIYLYFRDKEELCATIVQEVFERLSALLDGIQRRPDPPQERLRAGLRQYIEFGLEHPHHYRVAFGTGMLPEVVPGELSAADVAGLRCFEQLREILSENMAAGQIRQANIDVLSQTVWMFLHGVTDILICSGEVANFPWAPQDQAINLSLDLIMKSLEPCPNPPPSASVQPA